jgi:nucleoside-diphosphate-sugar epimerase
MYIDDCIRGTLMIMESDIGEPINLGSTQLVTINQLVDIVEDIAGVRLQRHYNLDAPKGVRGRNSDNSMLLERLGWAPRTRLEAGLPPLFNWIKGQMLGHRSTARPRARASVNNRC